MKTRRSLLGAVICAGTVLGLGSTAAAGEWGPGKPDDGYTPVKSDGVAASVCAFSGRDEIDKEFGGGEDIGPEGWDDLLWEQTKAKGKVQSPGQIITLFGPGSAQPGVDCRGNGG